MTNRASLGRAIRSARESRDWTQEYVAFLMSTHGVQWRAHTVSAVESGARHLSQKERSVMVALLGVDESDRAEVPSAEGTMPKAPKKTAVGAPLAGAEADAKFNTAVANLLKSRREEVGITFDDLAAASGVSRPTVARMMYGQRDLKVHYLRRLARVLGISLPALIEEAERVSND